MFAAVVLLGLGLVLAMFGAALPAWFLALTAVVGVAITIGTLRHQ